MSLGLRGLGIWNSLSNQPYQPAFPFNLLRAASLLPSYLAFPATCSQQELQALRTKGRIPGQGSVSARSRWSFRQLGPRGKKSKQLTDRHTGRQPLGSQERRMESGRKGRQPEFRVLSGSEEEELRGQIPNQGALRSLPVTLSK